jgi:hypothetical protein
VRRLVAFAVLAAAACGRNEVIPTAGVLQVSTVPDFGHVMLGRFVASRVRVQNVGRAPIDLDQVRLQIPEVPDYVVSDGVPPRLLSGESKEFGLTFAPIAVGMRQARLAIRSNATEPMKLVPLSGLGILGKADFGPQALDFGDVGVGSSSALNITFTNTADDPAAVTLAPPAGPEAAFFTVSQSGDLAVAPHATLAVEVRFRPQRTGAHNAALAIQPCPSCAMQQVPLTGNGIAANLTADPSPVDFGLLAPLQMATKTVVITNHGTRPAALSPATLKQDPNGPYTLGASGSVVLAQNQTASVDISFAPPRTGQVDAEIRIPTDDDGSPVLIIPVTGAGVGPAIEVAPTELGFPRTAVGLSVTKTIAVRNVGLDPTNTQPLLIGNIAVTAGRFTIAPLMNTTIPVGRQQYLAVTYKPLAEGSDTATLTIHSNDPLTPLVTIPLTGSASTLPDCSYEVRPPSLDFGSVNAGTSLQLWFDIRNVGATECAVANITTGPGTSTAFYVEPISTRMLQPGEHLPIPVSFSPDAPGTATGEVTFDTTSQGAPQGKVLLTGAGVPACFSIVPQVLDFGTFGLMCRAPTKTVQLQNACTIPVAVSGAVVGPSPSDAFAVSNGSGGAFTLAPGSQSTVSVSYAPTVAGTDNGALYVQTNLVPNPYLVPLTGTAVDRLTNTDTFVLPPVQKVDVLWVIDNSGSMSNKQAQLAANAGRFIDKAVSSGIDFHIAVTTTGIASFTGGIAQCPGGASGGEDGRFFPVDNSRPRILTPGTPDVKNVFAANAQVGICHYIEEGMEGMRRALSKPLIDEADDPNTSQADDGNAGFVREDARLYVVWVSDQQDQMPDPNSPTGDNTNTVAVQDYIRFYYSLKPGRPDMLSAAAIIGLPGSCAGAIEGVGTRYLDFINQVGGKIADVCASDWSGVIDSIAADAFKPQLGFPVSTTPDGRDVTVTVNGVTVPSGGHWRFDPTVGMYGAVVFDPASAPGPNATVTVGYALPCPP